MSGTAHGAHGGPSTPSRGRGRRGQPAHGRAAAHPDGVPAAPGPPRRRLGRGGPGGRRTAPSRPSATRSRGASPPGTASAPTRTRSAAPAVRSSARSGRPPAGRPRDSPTSGWCWRPSACSRHGPADRPRRGRGGLPRRGRLLHVLPAPHRFHPGGLPGRTAPAPGPWPGGRCRRWCAGPGRAGSGTRGPCGDLGSRATAPVARNDPNGGAGGGVGGNRGTATRAPGTATASHPPHDVVHGLAGYRPRPPSAPQEAEEQQPEPSARGRPLWRSSSWPAAIRAHCAVGRPPLRNCWPRVSYGCGQPAGESSQVSCRP